MGKRLLLTACLLCLGASLRAQGVIPREGEVHIPVIVLEFSDVHLSLENPAQHFQQMLNQEGYSESGATGSVRDYYQENSAGKFLPVFDIYGPVRLPEKMAAYGKDLVQNGQRLDDLAPELALIDACTLLDQDIDFSAYDANQDGIVDLCIFYFAGYDQAEGGPTDAIWSHHWNIQESKAEGEKDRLLDGVKLGYYFCSAELTGNSGTRPMGIGACCHELAHSLGLPDFYDVNAAQDGYAGGLYHFSLMSSGLYNNDGRTPPYLNALERQLLGWMPEIPLLPEGELALGPVQRMQAYRIPTATEGEYFLVESRDGTGWDAPLPEGLVVYHVDQSERPLGEIPTVELWNNWRKYNSLNNIGSHPCFYLVPSTDPTSLNYASAFNSSSLVYPGASGQLCYEPVDWEGAYTGTQLTCMDFDHGISFVRVLTGSGPNVNGLVRSSSGKPVPDAVVSLEGVQTFTLTDSKGFFQLPLQGEDSSYTLLVNKNGFQESCTPFSVREGSRIACLSVTLRLPGEAAQTPLSKFDPTKTSGYYPESTAIGAVRFSASELRNLAGRQLTEVVCYPYIYTQDCQIGELYITVDFGPVRVLNKKVENPVLGEFRKITVDLTDENLRIPEGLDIYIGYGFTNAGGNYPISVVYPGSQGNSFWCDFSLEKSDWKELYSAASGQYMDVMLGANAGEMPARSLAAMGYTSIDPGKGSYRIGDLFTPSLLLPQHIRVKEVEWGWDGLRLEVNSFRLSKGDHLLEALVTYEDGRREKLQLRVTVKE